MLKRLTAMILCCILLCSAALADSLPIYHKKGNNQAPFADDAVLMKVDVLGIRQGDCIIITCGEKRMLVDGGEGWRFQYVDAYLKEKGIDSFDYFFLTHAHDDHLEMQEKLIQHGYRVGKVISPYDENDSYTLWNGYKKLLKEKEIPFEKIATGDVMELGGATLTFYRCNEKGVTMNNHSACAMLQFGQARMFLAADIGGETQHWLLEHFMPAEARNGFVRSLPMLQLAYRRMVSYWNEFYRKECPMLSPQALGALPSRFLR